MTDHQPTAEEQARIRATALGNYYDAERRAGTDTLTAHERMCEFAKRLDDLAEQREREILDFCFGRTP